MQRLQKEMDVLQVTRVTLHYITVITMILFLQDGMLKEKTKKKRMEEDMDSLMTSINNI